MSYCYECGAEVAENDAFCPFCGISLNSLPIEDEIQDKTISVTESEMAEIVGKSASFGSENNISNEPAEQNDVDQTIYNSPLNWQQDNEPLSESETESEKHLDSNAPAELFGKNEEESLRVESDIAPNISEAPTPEIIENITPILETPSFQADSAKSFDESDKTNSQIDGDAYDSSLEFISAKPVEKSEPLKNSANNAENAEFEKAIELEPENSEENLKAKVEKSENTDLDFEFNKTLAQFSDSKSASDSSNVEAEDSSDFFLENENAIEMPASPIEESEERDTRFDSVKIMQAHRNYDSNPKRQSVPEPALEKPEKKDEQAKERSYTTPNIGENNTGGKKAKLKPLEEGTVLNGRYEIVRKIGGGGMGAVYLATDKNLGGILRAVKEMVQSYIEETQQEKAISDFKRESMLLTSLDHPSIPTIYDYFYDEKEARFYLVMKYISGGDLAARLRSAPEGRVDEVSVTDWAIQVADVLDYLHNRQPPIVYRDLKPANVMIDGNSGRVMLIDFGIARWVNKEEKGVTAVGTMGYAPPELFSGNVEPRSDIYSLGSTMFHLLTGADPQSNPLLIFDFQKHPRPRQINSALSDQMEKILMKSVEYNAENRFRTAAEMRDTLKQHLESLKAGSVSFGVTKTPQAVPLSEQTVFCGFCGQRIVASDMFCAFCGSKQPLAQHGVHAPDFVPAIMTAQLYVESTNELQKPIFMLEKDENLVGRRDPVSNIFPEVDLSKFDPQTKISRRHARIWREGGQFLLEDMGSSNGTMVMPVVGNAFRLTPHQPHPLSNGEKLKMGDTTLHFVIG